MLRLTHNSARSKVTSWSTRTHTDVSRTLHQKLYHDGALLNRNHHLYYLVSAALVSAFGYGWMKKYDADRGNVLSLLSLWRSNVTSAEHAVHHSDEDMKTVINWSGTHSVDLPEKKYFEPESLAELEEIVRNAHEKGLSIRPVGSALSPNGISFNEKSMVSMAHMDRVIQVDEENMTVTVQAGARVSQVIDELRKYNLTLPNLASIAEQQMGGFIQVGAHGTGAQISPVDDFVTKLKMVTPVSVSHGDL